MERTDPAILKLIFSVMNYAEAKRNTSNPLVKGFARVEQDTDLAYRDMLAALEDCHMYFPEVELMVEEILTKMSEEQQASRANEQLDTTS